MAFVKRGAQVNYPKGLTPGAFQLYEADAVGGVPIGGLVNIWPDGSGGGRDIGLLDTSTAPTLLRDTDQQPYVAFDGVLNALGLFGMPNYAGTVMTVYVVARGIILLAGTGNKQILNFFRAGVNAGVAAGTASFRRAPGGGDRYFTAWRDNILLQARAEPSDPNAEWSGIWSVYAFRFSLVSVDVALWSMFENGAYGAAQFGAPGTPLPAFNFDRFSVGGQGGLPTDIPPAAFPSDLARVDLRAIAVFRQGHSDLDVKNNMRFLAHKWNVPVLD